MEKIKRNLLGLFCSIKYLIGTFNLNLFKFSLHLFFLIFLLSNQSLLAKSTNEVRNINLYTLNTIAFQQDEYVLEGVVSDLAGKPLNGATVRLLNSKKKSVTTTDKEGKFRIYLSANSELLISMIGYKKQTVKVLNKKTLSVKLSPDEDQLLEEVVTTGYSKVRRETFTGAAKVITRKELEKFNNNNIFSVLQALEPAFKVAESNDFGSDPNKLPEINIRGVTSIGAYQANAPLVILDGFEVTLQTLYDMDIKRIQSVAILKDASSTSLYGSRGANGVIVIETLLPKDGKFTFTYDARPSLTLVDLSDYNMMNAREKLEYEKLAGIYKNQNDRYRETQHINQGYLDNLYASRLNNVLSGVDTYWLYQPIQPNNLSINHSLRMEGGGNQVRYSLDGNYNDFKGAMKESGRKRGSASFNLIYRIRDKFTFSNIANYQYSKEYNSRYGSFSQYVAMNPYDRIYDEDGKLILRYNLLDEESSFGLELANPLYNASLGFRNDSETQFLNNNISIDWLISPSLRITSRGVISRTLSNADHYTSPFHSNYFTQTEQTEKGSYTVRERSNMQYNGILNLQFSKDFNKHQINVSTSGEIRSNNSRGSSYTVTGFNDDRLISPAIALQYAKGTRPSYFSNPNNAVGVFGNLLYTYNNKYIVNATVRTDGSSLFGRLRQFGLFWSAGLSYNVHREKWFQNKYINRLRFFGNRGSNGSEGFNGDMLNTAYRYIAGNSYYRQYAATYESQGNPIITWPDVKQTSVGVEIGILKDLLQFNFNYYNRLTTNMVTPITVAPSLGFAGNTFTQNMGNVSNKGFEFTSNIRLYNNDEKGIYWSVNIGAVQNRSKLLRISNELRELNRLLTRYERGGAVRPSVYYEEGQSLGIIRGVRSLGIDPATGKEVFLDRNGNVTYTWNSQDQKVIGNSEATLFGNLSTSFNYKRFSLQLIGNYSIGQDVYNQTLVNKVENNSPFVNADRRVLQDRWKQPGDQTQFKSIEEFHEPTQVSSRFLQKENFLRLTSINMDYEFPAKLISKYSLQRLRLNFSTNDMVRLSNVRMERGIDYPFARTYNFGLTAQF